ncbi:MAG TPA: NAD(P)H-dependent oxidoreductase [Saprospiraceae bacterium]|nr:NAD(P)H-dependent oxidoreductase [Saprospiraceae bacterium]HRN34653.1 NAD(P)H-dependent oxidoreductase [Saprospiraceae bacterium]HRP85585.1 NAD(P)H-dependent oxidoreductase [Saprospiraceae bacterium]
MVITIISGSPSKNSVSIRIGWYLMHYIKTLAPEVEVNILDCRKYEVPLDDATYKNDGSAPKHLQPLVELFFRTDGFILLSPEYNGSYTPSLKNLLNHFPKLDHKACGIVTASDGALGGMRAAQQLQQLIAAHFGIISPYMLIVPHVGGKFNEEAELTDETFSRHIIRFVDEYLWLFKALFDSRKKAFKN